MKKVWHIIKAVLAAVLAWVFLGRRERIKPVKPEREEELEQRVDDLKERQRRRKAKIGGTLILLLFLSWPVGATNWEALYHEAERDLDEALAIIEEYQEILEAKNREIERLSRPVWGITAGIDLGDSARWRLGVARKKGSISFGAGIGGGDAFSIWWEAGLWIR